MKTYRQREKQGTKVSDSTKGPDEAKIKELLDRTNYTLDVTTGQRKYGGPPPESVYSGAQPNVGTEVSMFAWTGVFNWWNVNMRCFIWSSRSLSKLVLELFFHLSLDTPYMYILASSCTNGCYERAWSELINNELALALSHVKCLEAESIRIHTRLCFSKCEVRKCLKPLQFHHSFKGEDSLRSHPYECCSLKMARIIFLDFFFSAFPAYAKRCSGVCEWNVCIYKCCF